GVDVVALVELQEGGEGGGAGGVRGLAGDELDAPVVTEEGVLRVDREGVAAPAAGRQIVAGDGVDGGGADDADAQQAEVRGDDADAEAVDRGEGLRGRLAGHEDLDHAGDLLGEGGLLLGHRVRVVDHEEHVDVVGAARVDLDDDTGDGARVDRAKIAIATAAHEEGGGDQH